MNTYDLHRMERLSRRLQELRAWRNASEHPVDEWRLTVGGDTHTVRLGAPWPVVATPVELAAVASVPPTYASLPVELDLWLGGEGFVRLSTGLESGLNPMHRTFRISDSATGEERIEIYAEVSPKGMFGTHIPHPVIERAHLVVPETDVRALERDLSMVLDSCSQYRDHDVASHLLDTVDAAFATLAPTWPTGTEIALTRLITGRASAIGGGAAHSMEEPEVYDMVSRLWSRPPAPRQLEPLPDEARAAVRAARSLVAERLKALTSEYPPHGRVALTGHAHLDLAWLWPLAETRRKARRTFSTMLDLMDRYPDFIFNQSSAQAYAWIEQDAPDLFQRILERAKEGRWEPVGGSWLEPDCQVTGGEAFIRQLFYGQRYFEEKFGRRHTAAWLPDVFGFSPGIPQLLRDAGIPNFFTIKVNWNETNVLPYDIFKWEGIDGTTVLVHTFNNPGSGYNGNVIPQDVGGTWQNFRGKRLHPETLLSFGWGDGGGGPTDKMLENYARLKEFPASPRLRMTKVEEFFAGLPTEGLPTWVGELYLELHRGTLTSQGKTKKLNREAEHRLAEAESAATLATQLVDAEYPHDEIEELWKTTLLNQFHDILPGSSILEVYEDSHEQMSHVVLRAAALRDEAMQHIASQVGFKFESRPGNEPVPEIEQVLVMMNNTLFDNVAAAVLPGLDSTVSLIAADGDVLQTQETAEGLLVHDERTIQSLGWTAVAVCTGGPPPQEMLSRATVQRVDGGVQIANDQFSATIGDDGTLHSLLYLGRGAEPREALRDRANQLWAHTDYPREWEAWDVDEGYALEGEEVASVESIEITESGPLRASVRVVRRWHNSTITQTYSTMTYEPHLRIHTHIDWHERRVMLKARFPIAVHATEATYETICGVVRRPTHTNTSWDQARFEVSGHRFADVSQPNFGVALLNDGKYGHSANGSEVALTLLRSPMFPHPLADEGEHEFTYCLLPHDGSWNAAHVPNEAHQLNSPPSWVLAEHRSEGPLEPEDGLCHPANEINLMLSGLKRAEDGDGMILRMYETGGEGGTAQLHFHKPVKSIRRTNLMEDDVEVAATALDETKRMASFKVRPFELITFRIHLAP